MGKVGVIYTGRLGDIVGTLPRSYQLYMGGHRVLHYVSGGFAEFIEKGVPYVEPRIVEGDVSDSYHRAKDIAQSECDQVFDRQIFPRLLRDYRGGRMTWCDYYYKDVPEWREKYGPFLFALSGASKTRADSLVVSMHGVSSPLLVNWEWVNSVIDRLRAMGIIKHVIYTCAPHESCPLTVDDLDHSPTWMLPAIISGARMAFMRNSGPSWMAYMMRIPTLHIPDSCFPDQDTAGLTMVNGVLTHARHMVTLPHGAKSDVVDDAISRVMLIPLSERINT